MLVQKIKLIGEKVVLLFLLFNLQACNYTSIEKEFPQVNEIKKGEKFSIILPENHTENSFWHFHDNKSNTIEWLNSVWHGNEKGIYFNFNTPKLGTDTLRFSKLKRNDTLQTSVYIVKVIE